MQLTSKYLSCTVGRRGVVGGPHDLGGGGQEEEQVGDGPENSDYA